MSLTLYLHPLSSFCHKVLIALYENDIPFEPHVVNLGDPTEREAFAQVWPIAKFPVLRDSARDQIIPESTAIIEYLERHYARRVKLLPADPELAAEVRSLDRFYDLYIHEQMQKVVADKLRPADGHDPIGVDHAKQRMRTALGMVERQMHTRQWAHGDQFSMADCAAAPPLFFIDRMTPLASEFPNLAGYLGRLMKRPSYARALAEAQTYLSMFPG